MNNILQKHSGFSAQFIRYIALVFMFVGSATLHAHAIVKHAAVKGSSLEETPVLANIATDAKLYFNAGIELKFTKVTLVKDGTKKESILSFEAGKKPGELIVKLPALPEGTYLIRYKVLAEDGHLTEDIVRFRVKAAR